MEPYFTKADKKLAGIRDGVSSRENVRVGFDGYGYTMTPEMFDS